MLWSSEVLWMQTLVHGRGKFPPQLHRVNVNPAEHGETRQGRPRFPMPCHRWIVHPRESDFFPRCLRSIFHGRSAEGVTHFLGGCGLYSLASTRREEMLGEGSGTAGWGLGTCRHPHAQGEPGDCSARFHTSRASGSCHRASSQPPPGSQSCMRN